MVSESSDIEIPHGKCTTIYMFASPGLVQLDYNAESNICTVVVPFKVALHKHCREQKVNNMYHQDQT
jgi:hypothetical protein